MTKRVTIIDVKDYVGQEVTIGRLGCQQIRKRENRLLAIA